MHRKAVTIKSKKNQQETDSYLSILLILLTLFQYIFSLFLLLFLQSNVLLGHHKGGGALCSEFFKPYKRVAYLSYSGIVLLVLCWLSVVLIVNLRHCF